MAVIKKFRAVKIEQNHLLGIQGLSISEISNILKQAKTFITLNKSASKKTDILREELLRMRQLMGMNGSLYQKPIMEDESKHHGDEQPNPADYKGGEANPEYRNALRHWEREHQRPPSPPPPPPSPPAPSPQKGPASTDDKKSPRKLKTKGMSVRFSNSSIIL